MPLRIEKCDLIHAAIIKNCLVKPATARLLDALNLNRKEGHDGRRKRRER
jgi:hypothetical protein